MSGRLRGTAVADGALVWARSAHAAGVLDAHARAVEGRSRLVVLGDTATATGGNGEDFVRTLSADTGERLCAVEEGGRCVSALLAVSSRNFLAGCRCGDINLYQDGQCISLALVFRLVEAILLEWPPRASITHD